MYSFRSRKTRTPCQASAGEASVIYVHTLCCRGTLKVGGVIACRQSLLLNRRVLVEKMRSIPAKAKELIEALEDCKDGPHVDICRTLPQLISDLQSDLGKQ